MDPLRLPRGVTPRRYELDLTIDPDGARFSGRVRIEVSVAEQTRRIVLHALDLSLGSACVNGRAVDAARIVVDRKAETVTLRLDEALAPGDASLELSYDGAMNRQMRGLYESRAAFSGREERYAFTHLEPTHARRLLPSFDEPDFKASFVLKLTAPAGLTLLSNMPAVSRVEEGGRQTVVFGETPKMSTYLLAVAAARLSALRRQVAGTEVAVWTRPGEESQAAFALDVAEQALTGLNAYFAVPYQLPKLDLVAVPDFAAGAMENWGAIFFRDSALLIDPALSSIRARKRVAEVVTHEIVHQWFGNLVTMAWWNDLWLNEAFATWAAYKMVDRWRPQWGMWQDFEQDKKMPLRLDALRQTRAIVSEASSSAEIQAMFDPLTYEKGGAILRMLEEFLGEDAFRAAVQAYMRRFKYANASAADLWRELDLASGQPVSRMASDWLFQPGYPIVSASGLGGRRLKLAQRRFCAHGAAAEAQGRWSIPVVLRYRLLGDGEDRLHRLVLSEAEAEVALPGPRDLKWVYPNSAETGFYRVALEGELFDAALTSIGELHPIERAGLLGHLWARARAGEAPLLGFLDLLRALRQDGSRLVIEEVAGSLRFLHDELAPGPRERQALCLLAKELLGGHWLRLGWRKDGLSDEDKLSRGAVFSVLSALDAGETLCAETARRVSLYLADPSQEDPLLVSPLLAAAARFGAAELFEAYRLKMASAATPEQRDLLLKALAEFRPPELARRLLAMTLAEELRAQDAWKPYLHLFAGPCHRAEAWAFVQAHWGALRAKLGPRGATRIIAALSGLITQGELESVRAFFGDPANAVEMAGRALAQSLEAIELNARFKAAGASELSAWLLGG